MKKKNFFTNFKESGSLKIKKYTINQQSTLNEKTIRQRSLKMKILTCKMYLLVLLINILGLNSVVYADTNLDVPFFSQQCGEKCDQAKMTEIVGDNVSNYGCTMTSFAMALAYYGANTDHLQFHDWLILPTVNGYEGDMLKWNTDNIVETYASEVFGIDLDIPNVVTYANDSTASTAIRNAIKAGYPVVIKKKLASGVNHWVIATEENYEGIYYLDPWETTLDTAKKLLGAYLGYVIVEGPNNYSDKTNFDFSDGDQKWSTGYDTELVSIFEREPGTFAVNIKNDGVGGLNPGVQSPKFITDKFKTNRTVISVVAKVSGFKTATSAPMLYVRDEKGSWNNPVYMKLMESTFNDGVPFDGLNHRYEADLSVLRSDASMTQFSLELTSGGSDVHQRWMLDNVSIIDRPYLSPTTDRSWSANTLTAWNFNQAIPKGIINDDFLRLNSAGSIPSMDSPYLGTVESDLDAIEVSYSADDHGSNKINVFSTMHYDIGNGFDGKCFNLNEPITMNNSVKNVIFVIPQCAKSNSIRKVRFVLFNDNTYSDANPVYINVKYITFQKTLTAATANTGTVYVTVAPNPIIVLSASSATNNEINWVSLTEPVPTGGADAQTQAEIDALYNQSQSSTSIYASPYNLSASALSSISVKASWTCPANASSCIVSLVNRQTNQVVGPFYKTNGTSADVAQTFTFQNDSWLYGNTQYEVVVKAQYIISIGTAKELRWSEEVRGVFVTTLSPASVAGNPMSIVLCDEHVNYTCANEKSSFDYTPKNVYMNVRLANLYYDTLYIRPELYYPSGAKSPGNFALHGRFDGETSNPWYTFMDFTQRVKDTVNRVGQWNIKLYCGNTYETVTQFCGEVNFIIEDAGPPPGTVHAIGVEVKYVR